MKRTGETDGDDTIRGTIATLRSAFFIGEWVWARREHRLSDEGYKKLMLVAAVTDKQIDRQADR